MHPQLGPRDLPHQQLRDEIQLEIRTLVRDGKLPHNLLDHHWFRGRSQQAGPFELILPATTDHFPLDGISLREGIPASLASKDYDPGRVVELFERSKDYRRAKDQAKLAAGKKVHEIEWMTADNTGLPQQIDGVTCYLLSSWLELGFDRKKILEAVLKPLGYTKIKGEKLGYQKHLSDRERITCRFDLGGTSMAQFLGGYMEYHHADESVGAPLYYWGAFLEPAWHGKEIMCPMMVSTRRVLTMAAENIGFVLATLEANSVPRWRDALARNDQGAK